MGRDLRLNPVQDGKPLNYFVYPYVGGLMARNTATYHWHFRLPTRARQSQRNNESALARAGTAVTGIGDGGPVGRG